MLVFLIAALAFFAPEDSLHPALVQVIAYDAQDRVLAQGAGFFISKDGHVITARRILRGAARAEVKAAKTYAVKGVALDAVSAGLVRIAVEAGEGGTPAIPLFQVEPRAGEKVAIAGGDPIGAITGIRDVPALGKILRIRGPMRPEATGMPVLDSRGEAIGIALWNSAAAGFAIAAESVPAEVSAQIKPLSEWNATASRDLVPAAETDYIDGLTCLFLDDFRAALDSFGKAIAKNPRYAEAWFHSGFAQAKMGRQQEKIEAYKEAVRIKPDYAAARYSLGVSCALAGERESALVEYKALLGIDKALAERLEVLIGFIAHEAHDEKPPAGKRP